MARGTGGPEGAVPEVGELKVGAPGEKGPRGGAPGVEGPKGEALGEGRLRRRAPGARRPRRGALGGKGPASWSSSSPWSSTTSASSWSTYRQVFALTARF